MRIGFCNGCFDLFHDGHKEMLTFATHHCDYLIVALNSDASVSRLKGEGRPVWNWSRRMTAISAYLDYGYGLPHAIVPFEGREGNLIMEIRPDVVIVGYDHAPAGESVLAIRGIGWKNGAPIKRIPVVVAPHVEGVSTTRLVEERKHE